MKQIENQDIIRGYLQNLPPETLRAYKQDWKIFTEITGKINPVEITIEDCQKYVQYLKSKDYRNNTYNRKLYSIKKIFGELVKAGFLEQSPIDQLMVNRITEKPTRNGTVNLTLEEIQHVIKQSTPKTGLVIKLLTNTGMRAIDEGIRSYKP